MPVKKNLSCQSLREAYSGVFFFLFISDHSLPRKRDVNLVQTLSAGIPGLDLGHCRRRNTEPVYILGDMRWHY